MRRASMTCEGCVAARLRYAACLRESRFRESVMGLISLLWGIVAIVWMILALIPVIGITNWLLIPFAGVGAIIAAVGIMLSAEKNRRARAGLLLNAIAIVIAMFRLSMSGGLF